MRVVPLLSLLALFAACGDPTASISTPSANPADAHANSGYAPTPTILSFVISSVCAFDVGAVLEGKEKVTLHPNGRLVIASPGLTATLTNLSSGATWQTGITGTIRVNFLDNGDAELELTGRNLVEDEFGLWITIGQWSITVDPAGASAVPLAGTGRVIDVCDALS